MVHGNQYTRGTGARRMAVEVPTGEVVLLNAGTKLVVNSKWAKSPNPAR